jgi:hypothetical protein
MKLTAFALLFSSKSTGFASDFEQDKSAKSRFLLLDAAL